MPKPAAEVRDAVKNGHYFIQAKTEGSETILFVFFFAHKKPTFEVFMPPFIKLYPCREKKKTILANNATLKPPCFIARAMGQTGKFTGTRSVCCRS